MERTCNSLHEGTGLALMRPEDKPTASRSSTVTEDKKNLFNTYRGGE